MNARKLGDILTGIRQKHRVRKKSKTAPPIKNYPVESPPTTASAADEKLNNLFLTILNANGAILTLKKRELDVRFGVLPASTLLMEKTPFTSKKNFQDMPLNFKF